ncbi:hypothetical protein [Arthrobacter sp. ATA002]|uniref:hypothetical protein n=1 Tax=Arthrobacter sp. ATA002 TaxID=2991715 RepID=UPI002E335A3C|nr:hypothetical protein [Arthrobacter sp. ATA002]
MRGQDDGGVLEINERMNDVVELPACLGIDSGGGLVEEQQLGPAHGADGDVAGRGRSGVP